MQISIVDIKGRSHFQEVKSSDTIASLKTKICTKENIPTLKQKLVFGVKTLEDEQTLDDYGIKNGSKVYLLLKLKEGAIMVNDKKIASETSTMLFSKEIFSLKNSD